MPSAVCLHPFMLDMNIIITNEPSVFAQKPLWAVFRLLQGWCKTMLGPVASQTRIEFFPQIADSQNVTLDFLRCASVNIAIFKVVSSSFSQRFVWWILYDLLSKSI